MILCCGEALIDMIPAQSTNGETAFLPVTGGASLNTAIGLGRLGADVGLLSGVSRDIFGAQIVETAHKNNVSTELLIRSDRATTLAIVHLIGGAPQYSFYDENSAGLMITPDDLPDIPDTVIALLFGGISLAADPAATTYARLLERAGPTRVVMIDPNIRENFITDEGAYRARLDRMLRQSDIVKTSDEDLHWLIPGDQSLQEKAQGLADMGPQLILITLGAEGALAIASNFTVKVPAQKAVVSDTVGAGDTFNAGFLASLSKSGLLHKDGIAQLSKDDVEAALRLGTRAAAIAVSRPGTNPPWMHELDERVTTS